MIKSYVPRSPQNLRPGNTAANIPNLMKHIISTGLAVLALFILPENAAAQKRIVINSEPAGAEVYVNGIPTNQHPPAMLKNSGGKAFSVGFGKKGYEDGKLLVVKQKQFDGKKAYPTVIRWAIDSDPQGAHVFYRVLSSIPAVVKNTNETHPMTTPYEETRSFNILGLTYENSRDVRIEIKVVKTGYETQVKRFNVRQALDQQEISSYFMLVPKE